MESINTQTGADNMDSVASSTTVDTTKQNSLEDRIVHATFNQDVAHEDNEFSIQDADKFRTGVMYRPNTPWYHIQGILVKLVRAVGRYAPHPTIEHSFCVIQEECDELKHEVYKRENERDFLALYREIQDVAVSCIRMMVDLDIQNQGFRRNAWLYEQAKLHPERYTDFKFTFIDTPLQELPEDKDKVGVALIKPDMGEQHVEQDTCSSMQDTGAQMGTATTG